MAKESTAHQIAGQHRTMDSHKRSGGPFTLMAHPAGQHRLAGPAFAAQQHHRVGSGGQSSGLQKGAVGGIARGEAGVSLCFAESILEFEDLSLQNTGGDHVPGGIAYLIGSEGLGKVVGGSQFHRLDGRLESGESSDDNDPNAGLTPKQFREDGESGFFLEPEIKKNHVEAAASIASRAPAAVPTPRTRPPSGSRHRRTD